MFLFLWAWQDPLAHLEGASSALTIETDVLQPITVTSTEPTLRDTAYGLLQVGRQSSLQDI